MTTLLRRLGAFLLEPPEATPASRSGARPAPSRGAAAAGAAPGPAHRTACGAPGAPPARAAVLGAPAYVPSMAAACAGELRARAAAPAALVCLWRPGGAGCDADDAQAAASSPAGATTPGARRVAAQLATVDLAATACGRLAWLALPDDAAAAATALRRTFSVADVPVVIAVAGARPEALEPVLASVDLALAVLPADAEEALRALALAALPGATRHVVPPLPPGPPRWAALAGLTRLRSLPREPA